MWELVNETPFAAERSFLRDRDGAEVLVVVVKATFALGADGATSVADEQEGVAFAPAYLGEAGRSSLRCETDLVLAKGATDVLVHGSAHAAGGKATIAVEASVRAGPLQKRIRVVGDRTWDSSLAGLLLGDPEPFEVMPVRFERAFGGEGDARNPVGVGFASAAKALAGQRAPNLEEPGEPLTSWKQRPRPVSFGPIDRAWSPRRELAGTHDERWERERMPLVPEDFDARFHQAAPEDQQVAGFLRGGEPFELRHLTADGVLRFTLPEVPLRVRSVVAGRTVRHTPAMHTVLVDAERRRVVLVWQVAYPCHHSLHAILRTTVSLPRRRV